MHTCIYASTQSSRQASIPAISSHGNRDQPEHLQETIKQQTKNNIQGSFSFSSLSRLFTLILQESQPQTKPMEWDRSTYEITCLTHAVPKHSLFPPLLRRCNACQKRGLNRVGSCGITSHHITRGTVSWGGSVVEVSKMKLPSPPPYFLFYLFVWS